MIKGMTLPKGGNRLPLILGLVLGLVAFVLVLVVLTGAEDKGGGTVQTSGGGDTPVAVANQPIAAGVKITPEMVTIKTVAKADAITGAIGTTEGLVGKVTRVSIVANEQISDTKVIGEDLFGEFGANPPLSLIIDPGTRGVSAQMSSLIGAGGNIRPGDWIDIILIVEVSINTPEGQFNDTVAGTILQNVRVLAIDQERTNPDPAAGTDPNSAKEENEAAITVTLSLTPSQAEVVAVADQCGAAHNGGLKYALRGPGDPNKLSNRAEWPADGDIPSCVALLGVATLGE